jgi:uncharacterized protein YdeI (YjbR/CyaY-like superfamily)
MTFEPKNKNEWYNWLKINYNKSNGVWIILKKNNEKLKDIDILEIALCFGWIDSVAKKSTDMTKKIRYYGPRRKGSGWSQRNKQIIDNLIKDNKMEESGLKKIQDAINDGSWTKLDEVEQLIIPNDLKNELSNKKLLSKFELLSKSKKKMFLEKLVYSKKIDTRLNRIKDIIIFLNNN